MSGFYIFVLMNEIWSIDVHIEQKKKLYKNAFVEPEEF